MDKASEDIEDINFIISEIIRFASMEFHELIEHIKTNKQDGLYSIPHPFNKGELICGKESFKRFFYITKRHLATLKDSASDFDESEFTQELIKEFSNKFLKNQNEVNKSTTQSLLATTLKKAKATHKELTHYIPCIVVGEDKQDRFKLNIVEFIRMEIFLHENQKIFLEIKKNDFEKIKNHYEEAIKKNPKEQIPNDKDLERRANFFVDKLIQYFSEYKWIAKVTIPPCDKKVSRNRAEIVIDAALDILKLFFGEFHGKNLRMGHSYSAPEKVANLVVQEGIFNISYSRRGTKDYYIGDDWYQELTRPEVHPYLIMASSTLDARISPIYRTHLKERLLDALSWYGQGISDNLPSTKIVKYVACWERLVITKKEKDLTSTVTKRVALLAYDGYRKTYEETLKEAKKIYEWRSNLMHGTSSPFAPNIDEVIPTAERITQATLFKAIDLFVYLSHRKQNLSVKELEAEYIKLELQEQSSQHSNQNITQES